MATPIRILTAVPICDGHDSAINTINLEFIRHGIEVIYLGYHRSVGDIVRAAIQEDVRPSAFPVTMAATLSSSGTLSIFYASAGRATSKYLAAAGGPLRMTTQRQ